MSTFKKEARQRNIPLKFIHNAVTDGNAATLQHYEANLDEEIQDFHNLEESSHLLFRYFNIDCDNFYGRNDELIYTVNPTGLPNTRSKKQRVINHAKLVKAEKIARQHRRSN